MKRARVSSEVLVMYAATATDARGIEHTARARGRARENGRWEIWLELEPVSGGAVVRTGVETTQPDREAATLWACGISRVYLNGALARASASAHVRDVERAQRTLSASALEHCTKRELVAAIIGKTRGGA